MKKENDANEKPKASEDKLCAMLGAGQLTAALCKAGDEESGWRYRFNIFRMSKMNGRVTHRFLPRDVPDLAKLAQLLAFTFSEEECLDRELRDDLSCLFACLEQVFPATCTSAGSRPRLSHGAANVLRSILRLYWGTEQCHFAANPHPDHVYRKLLLIDRWLSGAISPENVVLSDIDLNSVRETFGVCPLCGTHDDRVNLGDYHWYICQTHQTRWCIGYNRLVPEVYEDSEMYQENWERIRNFRVVEPLRPTFTDRRRPKLMS